MAKVNVKVWNLKTGDELAACFVTDEPYINLNTPRGKCNIMVKYHGAEQPVLRTWGKNTTVAVLNRV